MPAPPKKPAAKAPAPKKVTPLAKKASKYDDDDDDDDFDDDDDDYDD